MHLRLFNPLAIAALALLPLTTLADTVTVSNNPTVVLPSDGSKYTLQGGTFTSLEIGKLPFFIHLAARLICGHHLSG